MLFCDLDGVCADFDEQHRRHFGFCSDKTLDNVDWSAVEQIPDYYLTMPPMPDLPELWLRISRYQPIILTGVPGKTPEYTAHVARQKREWVRRTIGGHVTVITCRSAEKSLYAAPGDILIDDWPRYKYLWTAKGGVWITHIRASATSGALQAMGL